MKQAHIPAVFMRGGTSKAVMFHARDLPSDRDAWAPIFRSAIGAGDPSARQLDGMGGGVSSLSKVCVIGPPSRPDADVDYTFAQIGVIDDTVDYAGNCGNMSSAIGPFAIDEGLMPPPADGRAVVRIHNTNTSKIIVARFAMEGRETAVDGAMSLDGVAGTGAPIRLEFMAPGGAGTGKLLPTGRPVDELDVPGLGRIAASLVDAANPCVFVAAETLGCTGAEMPEAIERNAELQERLEAIRRAASVAMGLARDLDEAARIKSVPKVAMVSAPRQLTTLAGASLGPADMNIVVRMISVGQAHRAVALTGALCLAVATRLAGSIPASSARGLAADAAAIRIAHPSGIILVDAKIAAARDGTPAAAEFAAVYRTARRLFEGRVLVRGSAVA
jgi:2-methylaconitate cis-trans-isomerase PrpF